MDLSSYKLEDVILSAMKSEIDSRTVYLTIAETIKNALLKDKIKFIADEEERHKIYLEDLFKKRFPEKDIVLPEVTIVPLPALKIDDESISPVEVFKRVMEVEKSAHEFYNSFAELFENDNEIKNTLLYFATMEMGHYKLFEIEKDNMERFEEYNDDWPMMHLGP